jgi:hypothetical protein
MGRAHARPARNARSRRDFAGCPVHHSRAVPRSTVREIDIRLPGRTRDAWCRRQPGCSVHHPGAAPMGTVREIDIRLPGRTRDAWCRRQPGCRIHHPAAAPMGTVRAQCPRHTPAGGRHVWRARAGPAGFIYGLDPRLSGRASWRPGRAAAPGEVRRSDTFTDGRPLADEPRFGCSTPRWQSAPPVPAARAQTPRIAWTIEHWHGSGPWLTKH